MSNSSATPYRIGSFILRVPDLTGLQLDVAGFLAILGEGSILANAQVAALSPIIFLPRLMPAPQALMMPSRPTKLEPAVGYTTGVQSGNHRDYINHVGHVLVDAESEPDYSVRCVEIRRKHNNGEVQAKILGPLWVVAILGFVESVVLFIFAWWKGDHATMLATVSLSVLSSLTGVANKWTLNLPKRRNPGVLPPPGNVVIRYSNGNFLVVQCQEDVARELYFAPEIVNYLISHSREYRMISLVGTFLLIIGIISLSNASTELQIGFAAAYIILNTAYWIVAALPPELHWDMSCFEVLDQSFEQAGVDKEKQEFLKGELRDRSFVEYNATFTLALWKAIVATKSVKWIKRSQAIPETPAWNEWLREAKKWANKESYRDEKIGNAFVRVWKMPAWDPQAALGELIKKHMDDPESD